MASQEELDAMIAQEAKELKDAPVIQPIIGQAFRCHICGQVFHYSNLKSFDTHIENGPVRLACPNCHPDREVK